MWGGYLRKPFNRQMRYMQTDNKKYAFCQLPIKQRESTCFWKMYSKPPYDIFVISVYFVLCVFYIP